MMFRKTEAEMMEKEAKGGMVRPTYELLTDQMGFCDEGAPMELCVMEREANKLLREVMTAEDVKVSGNA